MGKVLVKGHAEQEVAPDYCEITLIVDSKGTTAAKATKAAMEETEKLLMKLSDLGIKPESIQISRDSSSRSSSYRETEVFYESSKLLKLRLPVNIPLVNRIHDIIASGFENTSFGISYDISNRSELMADLKKQAIRDSRRKADMLAETVYSRIIGIGSANMEGSDDMDMDITDLELSESFERERNLEFNGKFLAPDGEPSILDKIIPEKITLQTDVTIVWKIE